MTQPPPEAPRPPAEPGPAAAVELGFAAGLVSADAVSSGPPGSDADHSLPGLDEAPKVQQLKPHDRVPDWLRRMHVWAMGHMPASNRRRVALAVALVAAIAAASIGASRLLHFFFPGLDALAYLGLFVVNWVGAGGLLVPIPGARVVGWLMIVQQGATFDPLVAGLVGGVAMAIGQISYYVAANAGAHRARPVATAAVKPSMLARVLGADRAAHLKERIVWFITNHGFATVLALSLVPNPLTTFACITAGAVGMGFRRFVAATFVGRVSLGLVLAYIGQSLFDAIGRLLPG